MRKSVMILLAASAFLFTEPTAAQTLDELARMVREAATTEAGINQEREALFVHERDKQSELLAQARRELENENARSDGLRVEYDQN